MPELILSPKFKAFLHCSAPVEFLEGTTSAGKTTVGIYKFILKCAESPKKQHVLSGLDLGTIEKNIINKDLGILDIFGILTEYFPAGKGKDSLPHIILHTNQGDKKIYVLGYDNAARWKKSLGAQYGCLYIDEINIADIDYVRESVMRCDYLMATLNPDDNDLPIYREYINHARPLPEWAHETPPEILEQLSEEPKSNWVHWFFGFKDNAALTPEKIEMIKQNVPVGSKLWKNKVCGIRGRATGLVFENFDRKRHCFQEGDLQLQIERHELRFVRFSAGLDTAYSSKSADTIAMTFIGIDDKFRLLILEENIIQNADLKIPVSPSDLAGRFVDFLEHCRQKWGFSRDVFIDSADQATISELKKYKRQTGSLYQFNDAYKKIRIIDRIHLQSAWISSGHYLVNETCTHHLHELNCYAWQEDKDEPEDKNDHTINSVQYAFIPYKDQIGKIRNEVQI